MEVVFFLEKIINILAFLWCNWVQFALLKCSSKWTYNRFFLPSKVAHFKCVHALHWIHIPWVHGKRCTTCLCNQNTTFLYCRRMIWVLLLLICYGHDHTLSSWSSCVEYCGTTYHGINYGHAHNTILISINIKISPIYEHLQS